MAEHGTRTAYLKGCRCVPCGAANRRYQREWHAERRQRDKVQLHGYSRIWDDPADKPTPMVADSFSVKRVRTLGGFVVEMRPGRPGGS